VDLEKLCHGTPLVEINNFVDNGPLFLPLWTVNAIQGLRLKLVYYYQAVFRPLLGYACALCRMTLLSQKYRHSQSKKFSIVRFKLF